jgi:hypothetical protein
MANDTDKLSGDFRCNCHFKHAEKITQIEDDIKTHLSDHKDQDKCVRAAIEKKLPNKLFYLLITVLVIVMGGMLTFQWKNYEKLGSFETRITKEVAVIKTKLGIHMKEFPKEFPDYREP